MKEPIFLVKSFSLDVRKKEISILNERETLTFPITEENVFDLLEKGNFSDLNGTKSLIICKEGEIYSAFYANFKEEDKRVFGCSNFKFESGDRAYLFINEIELFFKKEENNTLEYKRVYEYTSEIFEGVYLGKLNISYFHKEYNQLNSSLYDLFYIPQLNKCIVNPKILKFEDIKLFDREYKYVGSEEEFAKQFCFFYNDLHDERLKIKDYSNDLRFFNKKVSLFKDEKLILRKNREIIDFLDL